jgi:hypothetical protein
MKADASAAVPEVLQLFLQQPSTATSNSTAVFKLLATSNTMRAAIGETLTGRLSLAYSSKDPRQHSFYSEFSKREQGQESFVAWLRQHGHLLRALHIQDVLYDFQDLLAAALRDAAASPKGLHLQSYDSDSDDSTSLAVLKALPAHSLTHLRVCMTSPMLEDDGGWQRTTYDDFGEPDEDSYAEEEFLFEMREEVSTWLAMSPIGKGGPDKLGLETMAQLGFREGLA